MIHYVMISLKLILKEPLLQDVLIFNCIAQVLRSYPSPHFVGGSAVHQGSLLLRLNGCHQVIASKDISLLPVTDGNSIGDDTIC
jgi:hypothetical protein